MDLVEGFSEVGGRGVGGDDGVRAGLDLDGAVAAGGLDELANGSVGLVLDPAADRQCREHDGQVPGRSLGIDRDIRSDVVGPMPAGNGSPFGSHDCTGAQNRAWPSAASACSGV